MIRIITDSASDLDLQLANEQNITVIPMQIQFGDTTYQDRIDLSIDRFYEILIESDDLPKTSQINPFTFEEIFEDVERCQDTAIVILLSSKLSGTYQSACNAAEQYQNIYVIDSCNVSVGEQCLVQLACSLRDQGLSASAIVSQLNFEKERIVVLALLDTLEYLKKGGRISATAALAGGLLSIKPVVTIQDGAVKVLGKARGSKNGNNMLVQEIKSSGGIDFSMPLNLGYSGLDQTLLNKYIEDSRSLWVSNVSSLPYSRIGSTIGTHVGPNAIAIAFFHLS